MNTIDKARIAQKISHKYVGQFEDDFLVNISKGIIYIQIQIVMFSFI